MRAPDTRDEVGYWTANLTAPTADDVSITIDGRRLDSLDTWLAYLTETNRLPTDMES